MIRSRRSILWDPHGVARGEHGIALATVMIAMIAMMGLAAATLSMSLGSQNLSKHDERWSAALSAAEAGIDDFLFLNNNTDGYWRNTPPLGAGHSPANPAEGTTAGKWNWKLGDGSSNPCPTTGPDAACFHYDLASAPTQEHGVVLRSTGRVGNVRRTVLATLRHNSFLDYLSFTNLETKNPDLYRSEPRDPNPDARRQWAKNHCLQHWYEYAPPGRPNSINTPSSSNCESPVLHTGDVFNGKVKTNDALDICGSPVFKDHVFTAYKPPDPAPRPPGDPGNLNSPDGAYNPSQWASPGVTHGAWLDYASYGACPTASPTFTYGPPNKPLGPEYQKQERFPADNKKLKTDAWNATGAPAGKSYQYGCVFTGQTAITFLSTGDMLVDSPYSSVLSAGSGCPIQNTTPLPGGMPSGPGGGYRCGVGWNNPQGYNCGTGWTMVSGRIAASALQKGLLVYVQNVPKYRTSDVNAFRTGCYEPHTNPNARVSNIALGYPYNETSTGKRETVRHRKLWANCHDGDAYVRGVMAGRVTIGAENNIVIGTSVSPEDRTDGQTNLASQNSVPASLPASSSASSKAKVRTGNLEYAPLGALSGLNSTNYLGLIANHIAWVYHPTHCSGGGGGHCNNMTPNHPLSTDPLHNTLAYTDSITLADGTTAQGIIIQAAIFALGGSFTVSGPDIPTAPDPYGPQGTMELDGSVTEYYRGTLGLPDDGVGSTSGFIRDWNYDRRFLNDGPPDFLDPTDATWKVQTWAEEPPDLTP